VSAHDVVLFRQVREWVTDHDCTPPAVEHHVDESTAIRP
jgi:hypothetical protein